MKILLATQNQHKLEEISHLLRPFDLDLVSLLDYPEIGEVVEDGSTLEANALIKARAGYDHTGLPTLADDTGLSVDALDGAPGVYAARYAGEKATYDDNVNKMLLEMDGVPDEARQAKFQTVAIYFDGQSSTSALGEVNGSITSERIGTAGFGYDPIFYIPEKDKTYSQMDVKEKNQLSHRRRAFEKLFNILKNTHQAFNTELR
ncbi:MAG: RdgB/HAM1 family non-canonical purine NTP pyrophosphatase [Candidatus Marinimicrobia bacterium]|nr:RdgB/HAM1 family non-canonical purine NTP pyrophosphatase [Candidatus Neomarinimicrobiota bacterium]MCF7850327.1 RdgB/HAM1 family non-canonical purine NTP pyrophosphatase [Candidatus Neomarinimicrobiota bacterium]MCF7904525.1 RdgB/HAM1 family non-canonical purine NTP pyrophosphatase [Candidatus Neomarinimicrobiota bacterium]